MPVLSQKSPSPPWFVAVVGAALAIVASSSSCTQRSLVEVDVLGDAPFDSVTLRLIAGGTSKDFPRATFDTATPFKAGIYLPDSVSGDVTVLANVLGSTGSCIGAGQALASGVAAGATSGPVSLTVTHTTACAASTTGTGGAGGSGTGTGGASGGGAGGAGGASGTGGRGAGGTSGGGTGGASGGGTGGMTGAGGQAAGELITNGDFSSGLSGWGLPAMLGTVGAPTVTSGALCVTLGATSSATIGYPSGGAAAFQLTGGTSYRFSYQASSSGGATLEAKVGQTMPPYDATGSDFMNETVGTSLQTLTHVFTRTTTDGSMGIAFNIAGGPATVCFDNVSLTPN